DAADRCAVDARGLHRPAHLLDIAPESSGLVEARVRRWLVGERKRDDTPLLRERVDARLHPLPASLDAGDDDNRNARTTVDDVHELRIPSPESRPGSATASPF